MPLTRSRRASLCGIGSRTAQPGNTATVAVNPCRKLRPPTGPISPAAKKPAAGAPPSSSSTTAASWSADAEHRAARVHCRRTRARPPAARRPSRPPAAAALGAGPHPPIGRRGRAAARPGLRAPGAPTATLPESGSAPRSPRTRKSPCSYSGLPPSMTIPISIPPAINARSRGLSSAIDPLDGLERRASGQLVNQVALGGGDRHLPAERRRALGDAGQQLDPFEADPDRAPLAHLLAEEQRRPAASESARWRARRAPAPRERARRQRRQRGLGRERVRVGSRITAPLARVQPRQPGDARLRSVLGHAWRGTAVASPDPLERRRPDRRPRSRIRARGRGRARRRRRSRSAPAGPARSCTPSSIASGAARWVPLANTTARSTGAPCERAPQRAAPPRPRPAAGSGSARDAGADLHAVIRGR